MRRRAGAAAGAAGPEQLAEEEGAPRGSLLVAAGPVHTQRTKHRLGNPACRQLRGVSEADRRLHFCTVFQDGSKAWRAFSLVRANEPLFSMCQIPVLCWAVCTCLNRGMGRGETWDWPTSIPPLFPPPPSVACSRPRAPAAGGRWPGTRASGEEGLRRRGLADADVRAPLHTRALGGAGRAGSGAGPCTPAPGSWAPPPPSTACAAPAAARPGCRRRGGTAVSLFKERKRTREFSGVFPVWAFP